VTDGKSNSLKRKTLPPEPGPFLKHLYEEGGLRAADIRANYVISRKRLRKLLREQGVEMHGGRRAIRATPQMIKTFEEVGEVAECARQFDLAWTSMAKRLERSGVYTPAKRPPRRRVPRCAGQVFARLHGFGWSVEQIERAYKINRSEIRDLMRAEGVELPPPTARKAYASPGMIAAYRKNLSLPQISDLWGISKSTAGKRLQRSGVELRPRLPQVRAPLETVRHFWRIAQEELAAAEKALGDPKADARAAVPLPKERHATP
jgi:hypothetical protein